MAQAARLNLRMQKELKLLLTDPPPGASFPSLSDDSSASLTSIDAHFKGPEGTVYADGVFKIKIQIPERYPFQPPIVTFATPIYHPNIDNGGRICLDTLNLPPKGSWQPSLNISTVLTSIGLLLSEANPDDGLMHDASREYKYNRQAFDQKARSMTEKYASPGESISSIGNCDNQIHTCPSTSKTELEGSESSTHITTDHEKFSRSTRKLSLESFGSSSNSEVPNHGGTKNHTQIGILEKAKTIATDFIRNPDKQLATQHKLSLKVPVISHSRNGESTKTNESNPCPSLLKSQNLTVNIPDSFPFLPVGHDQVLYWDEDFNERTNISANQEVHSLESIKTSHKSRNSFGKLKLVPQPAVSDSVSVNKDAIDKIERGSVNNKVVIYEKENLVPIQQLKPSIVSENVKQYNGKQTVNVAQNLSLTAAKLALDQLPVRNNKLKLHSENPRSKILNEGNDEQSNQICDDNNEQILSVSSPISEECIVLDSEDSDDENVPVRSKLSLARKHLLRKRKFKTTSDK